MLAFSPEQIQIINGNVERVLPFGESNILIDKNDFPTTGITGFSRVVVSPDESRMCFESLPPAPEPELYVSGTDGVNVFRVAANAANCHFGPLGNRLFYNNLPVGNTQGDIYSYNLNTQQIVNLTADLVESENVKVYRLEGVAHESNKLICTYQEVDPETGSIILQPEPCEVDI